MDKIIPSGWEAARDGSLDFTESIKTAMNEAAQPYGPGEVFLPSGKYKISGRLNVRNLVMLSGAGMEKTILKVSPDFAGDVVIGLGENVVRTTALHSLMIDSSSVLRPGLTLVKLGDGFSFRDSELGKVYLKGTRHHSQAGLTLHPDGNKNYSRFRDLVFDNFPSNPDGAFQVADYGDHQQLYLYGIKWYHCRLNLNFSGYNSYIRDCYINLPEAYVGGVQFGGGSEIKNDGSGGFLYRVRLGKYWNQFSDNYFDGDSGKALILCEVVTTQGTKGLPGVIVNGYNTGLNERYKIIELLRGSKVAVTKIDDTHFSAPITWKPGVGYPIWLEVVNKSFKRYTVASVTTAATEKIVEVRPDKPIDDGVAIGWLGCLYDQGNLFNPDRTLIRYFLTDQIDVSGSGPIRKLKKGTFDSDLSIVPAKSAISTEILVDGISYGDVISISPYRYWEPGLIIVPIAMAGKIILQVINTTDKDIKPPTKTFYYTAINS